MLAARQGRQGGKFGPVKPEFKVAKPPAAPPTNAPPTDAAIAQQIGFLQALISQRKSMGIETSELENYVIGTADKQGVRSVVERFISENRQKFDQDDPAGAAAYQLMKEAVVLSEGSLKASTEDAKLIYARLKFIRELAKKTEGEQSAIAAKLDEIIKPVEDQLKKRTSFGEFLKEKAETFKKTLPERLAAKIPVIGGLLSGFLKERRETQEDIEKYSGSLQEQISRRGRKTGELDIDEMGGGGRGGMAGRLGATPASDIPGLDLGGAGKGIPSTLGAIYKEVTKIRTLIEGKFSPTESDASELKARELELEGKAGGGKATEAAVKMVMGDKGGGGFMSSLMSNLLGSALGPMLMTAITSIGPMITGAIAAIGPALMAAIAGLGSAIAAIGSTLLTVAIPALVATVGAAIGGGLAWLINSGIDALFGTNLSELMFDKDTYTFGDMKKDADFAQAEKASIEKQQKETSTPEYIAAMSQDPRMLPKLIGDKKITGSQALDALNTYETKYGAGDDTNAIRAKILELDPSATSSATGNFAAVNAAQSATAAATIPDVTSTSGTAGTSGQSTTVGVLSASTPNTTMGKMLNQYSAEQAALSDAQAAGAGAAPMVNNTSSVNTRVSNVVNNFNDDLRIRNNEPTQKQMQTFSLVP